MGFYPGYVVLDFGHEHEVSTDKQMPLGTLGITQDGRRFRYTENGGVALVAARLCQSELPGGNFDELAVQAAAAIGATAISITNGATTIAADDFLDGYMNIEDDAGEGHLFLLDTHLAEAAGNATVVMNLKPGYSLLVALTTATTVSLVKNRFKDIVVHPSPPTAFLVGVAPRAVPLDNFCWIQVYGPASVLTEVYTGSPVVIARSCYASGTVNGAVGTGRLSFRTGSTAAGDETSFTNIEDFAGAEVGAAIANVAIDTNVSIGVLIDPVVGYFMEIAIDTEESLVFLTLD